MDPEPTVTLINDQATKAIRSHPIGPSIRSSGSAGRRARLTIATRPSAMSINWRTRVDPPATLISCATLYSPTELWIASGQLKITSNAKLTNKNSNHGKRSFRVAGLASG